MASASTLSLFSNLTVLPSPSKHHATLIFMHGLGDTADGWSYELRSLQKKLPNLKLVLPTAPIRPVTVNGGIPCTSWHDIHSLTSIDAEKMTGLEESTAAIQELIKKEIENGIEPRRIIIGGFSQGAGLSLYSALQMPSGLGGVISLSGYLPHYDVFLKSKLHGSNKKTPVLICHGTDDRVVKFEIGKRTADILSDGGVPVQFKSYNGLGHSSSPAEMNDIFQFVSSII